MSSFYREVALNAARSIPYLLSGGLPSRLEPSRRASVSEEAALDGRVFVKVSKVVVPADMSVDGIAGDPSWTRRFTDRDYLKYRRGQLMDSRALLLGRITYELLCRGQFASGESDAFAAGLRRIPKYIAPKTLQRVSGNAVLLDGDTTEHASRTTWRLAGTQNFDSGTVVLDYRPAPACW
ncbi:hypothetical protein [Nocardia sp. Root136]|uniref:hypothetical protein n=1 Tax=Nocardia sp. Root136 TaxID=1736458 RepID=UPI0019109575|nr:hypothetical protein [Nocardia sp. Root136]